MHFIIINPASPELNRGSFCYLPYLYASCLTRMGNTVSMFEDFIMPELDTVNELIRYDSAVCILVSVWSYPQVEWARMLNVVLEKQPTFFGYTSMIKSADLPCYELTQMDILDGIIHMPTMFKNKAFEHILLSDCDAHLSELGDATMYPMFTSYGCDRGCSFCPSAANTHNKRHVVSIETVKSMLNIMHENDMHNIHFTDEDFFFESPRAYAILQHANAISDKWNFIALASVQSMMHFITTYGKDHSKEILRNVKLVEVGLESADVTVSTDMGKGKRDIYSLAERCPVPILWLTMTFYPTDTVHSQYMTGRFLEQYGLPVEKMNKRIITNGTVGGLGQFYQKYEGTPIARYTDKLHLTMSESEDGVVYSTTPTRLVPSFLPFSILEKMDNLYRVKEIDTGNKQQMHERIDELAFWARLYRCSEEMNTCIDILVFMKSSSTQIDMTDLLLNDDSKLRYVLCIVILARLGYIDEVME